MFMPVAPCDGSVGNVNLLDVASTRLGSVCRLCRHDVGVFRLLEDLGYARTKTRRLSTVTDTLLIGERVTVVRWREEEDYLNGGKRTEEEKAMEIKKGGEAPVRGERRKGE